MILSVRKNADRNRLTALPEPLFKSEGKDRNPNEARKLHPTNDRRGTLWSAETCRRFGRLADWSVKQSRVQRLGGESGRLFALDGDESPAESGENSPHSKAWQRPSAPA
jgi:hypothetical protein